MRKFLALALIIICGCSTKSLVNDLYESNQFDYSKFINSPITIVPPNAIIITNEGYDKKRKNEIREEVSQLIKEKMQSAFNNKNIDVSKKKLMLNSLLLTKENKEKIKQFIKSDQSDYILLISNITIGDQPVLEKVTTRNNYGSISSLETNYVNSIKISIDIWGKHEGNSLLSFTISTEVTDHFMKTRRSSNLDDTIDALVDQIVTLGIKK